MILSELAPTYKLRTNIRPVRHAYLISSRSRRQLEEVMAYCCTQWGGISNLIIPLEGDLSTLPLHEYLLTLVEPDVIVSFLSVNSERTRHRHERLRAWLSKLWPEKDISLATADFRRYDRAAHPLSMISDEEARARDFLSSRFLGPRADRLALLAMFGEVYPGDEGEHAKLLRMARLDIGLDNLDLWLRQMMAHPLSSPLNLTGCEVHAYEVAGSVMGPEGYFELVVGDSVADLCLFWNVRAVRESTRFRGDDIRRVLLLPGRLIQDEGALGRLADQIRAAPPSGVSSNLDIAVYTASEESAEAWGGMVRGSKEFTRIRERIRVARRFGEESSASERPRERRPVTYASLEIEVPKDFREGLHYEIPRPVPLSMGENELRLEPPPGYRNRFHQTVMLDFQSDVWDRYPRQAEVARTIHDNALFTRYGVSFLAGIPHQASEFRLRLPAEWETLCAVFQRAGLQIQETHQTRYLDAVVQLLGGFENVEMIASRPAILLLQALAVPPTSRLAQRIVSEAGLSSLKEREVSDALRGTEVVVELSAGSRSFEQLRDGLLVEYRSQLLHLLSRLAAAGVIRRGFRLPCLSCGLTTWHPLARVDESVECPGCGERFPLPVQLPQGKELQVHYVLNSLVNRAWDQGVIPTLLAMHNVASRHTGTYCKAAGLQVLRAGEPVTELDFVMLGSGRLVAGEAKTGSILEEKDLRAAELAARAGFSSFHFCTLSSFNSEARSAVRQLRERLSADGRDFEISILSGEDLLREK